MGEREYPKPCPFCGEKPALGVKEFKGGGTAQLYCMGGYHKAETIVMHGENRERAVARAIEVWNRRQS